MTINLIVGGLAVLVLSAHLSAQERVPGSPDTTKASVRLGLLLLNPTIAVTNFGIDTNVFNQSDQNTPKRDLTLTLTPQTDLWLRVGRSWITGSLREDLVWFKTFAGERSTNDSVKVGWLLPLNRLMVNAGGSYLSARDRPGFEIDARSQRNEVTFTTSAEVRAGSKTFAGVRAGRRAVRFDSVATFEGVSLRGALNRIETSEGVTLRHQLTPLTGLTLDLGRVQDRFQFSPQRDSNSTSATFGIKLDPFALIKGSATFGIRAFRQDASDLPGYTGATATADLTYVAFDRTRLGLKAMRDVQYSFELSQPYYLLTGVSGSIEQQLVGPIEVAGRLGVQHLNYRVRSGVVGAAQRVDSVHLYGFTIGYRLGSSVRIGFNVDHAQRSSPQFNRDYHGLRFGSSVIYGL